MVDLAGWRQTISTKHVETSSCQHWLRLKVKLANQFSSRKCITPRKVLGPASQTGITQSNPTNVHLGIFGAANSTGFVVLALAGIASFRLKAVLQTLCNFLFQRLQGCWMNARHLRKFLSNGRVENVTSLQNDLRRWSAINDAMIKRKQISADSIFRHRIDTDRCRVRTKMFTAVGSSVPGDTHPKRTHVKSTLDWPQIEKSPPRKPSYQ